MKTTTHILLSLVALFMMVSCEITTEDADVASEIVGTYSLATYTTQTGTSTGDLSNNKVIVTKVDNTHVSIVLDYSDPTATDVTASNAFVTSTSTGYSFSQSFSNAELTGTVNGSTLTYNLTYTDGDYVNLTATK